MAKAVEMVVTGDKEINKMLAEFPAALQKKWVKAAARPAAKALLPTQKRNTPTKTEALKRSMTVRAVKRSRVRVGLQITTGKKGYFRGKTFYGAFQEWGWRIGTRPTKSRRETKGFEDKRKKVEGKYYAKRSADMKRRSILTIYRSGLMTLIKEEMARNHVKQIMSS